MPQSKVKVAVRIRPLTAKEILQGSAICTGLSHSNDYSEILLSSEDNEFQGSATGPWGMQDLRSTGGYFQTERRFRFDKVFGVSDEQEKVFRNTVEPIVEKFLEGYNATVFVYGQTGSGKTYTMGTDFGSVVHSDNSSAGIIPRAMAKVFNYIESCDPSVHQFKVTISYLELYNEEFIDLMDPGKDRKHVSSNTPRIREDGSGKISITNASVIEAYTLNDLLDMLKRGSICRTTGSTDMNISSSRSHAIFTVTLCQHRPSRTGNEEEPRETVTSIFNFVDLAGSERLKKTHATGNRMREGISINQGLLALGNVICALSDDIKRTGHIPYRDSKLTRFLQNSLGGNSETLMLACVSPSNFNLSETLSTLNYATRASNISNKLTIDSKLCVPLNFSQATFRKMEKELESLRSMVSVMKSQLLAKGSCSEQSLQKACAMTENIQMDSDLRNDGGHTTTRSEDMDNILSRSELHLKCSELLRQLMGCRNEVCALRFICDRQNKWIHSLQSDACSQFFSSELSSYINEAKAKPLAMYLSDAECGGSLNNELLGTLKYALASCTKVVSHINHKLRSANILVEWYENKFDAIAKRATGKTKWSLKPSNTTLLGKSEALSGLKPSLSSILPDELQWELKNSVPSVNSTPSAFGADQDLSPNDSILQLKKLILREVESERRFNTLRYSACERAAILNFIEQAVECDDDLAINVVDFNIPDTCPSDGTDNLVTSRKKSVIEEEVFSNLSKIEAAIDERQTLADNLKSLKIEFETVTSSYNQKLQVLENKLLSMERERDEAIKRLQSIPTPLHAFNSVGLRSLKVQNRRLRNEISKSKKKVDTLSYNSKESMSYTDSARASHMRHSMDAIAAERSRLIRDIKALKLKKKALIEQKTSPPPEGKHSISKKKRLPVKCEKTTTEREVGIHKDPASDGARDTTVDEQLANRKHALEEEHELDDSGKKMRYSADGSSMDYRRYDYATAELQPNRDHYKLRLIKQEFMQTLFEVVRIKRRQKLLNRIRGSRNKLLLRRRELLLERERCLMRNEEEKSDITPEISEREKKINRYMETTQLELAKCEAEMESLSTSGAYRIEKKWMEVLYTIRKLSGHEARAICEQLSTDFVRVLYDLQQNRYHVVSQSLSAPEQPRPSYPQLEQSHDVILDKAMHSESNQTPEPADAIALEDKDSELNNSQAVSKMEDATTVEYTCANDLSEAEGPGNSREDVYTQDNISSRIANVALRLRKAIGKPCVDIEPSAMDPAESRDMSPEEQHTGVVSRVNSNLSVTMEAPSPQKLDSSHRENPVYSQLD